MNKFFKPRGKSLDEHSDDHIKIIKIQGKSIKSNKKLKTSFEDINKRLKELRDTSFRVQQ